MYGESNPEFIFSNAWLERFRSRHGIKCYGRFSKNTSIAMENIEDALTEIQAYN